MHPLVWAYEGLIFYVYFPYIFLMHDIYIWSTNIHDLKYNDPIR